MNEILNSIFKAYDVRGKVGTELTPALAKKIGIAFGNWLPTDGPVAVGRDMRPDSEELANAIAEGLQEAGRDVINIGQITSDMIYFAVGKYGYAGGAVVTASHNPGEYNGIKFCREEAQGVSIDSGLSDIKENILSDALPVANTTGTMQTKDVTDAWIDHVLSFIDVSSIKPFNIAVDCGNGMAGAIMPALEAKLPLTVHQMYYELDGTFPNHQANPLVVENLTDISKDIVTNNRDFGMAFDGDGDRAFFIDEKGRQVTGTILTALLARHILQKEGSGTILYNAICGRIVPEVIKQYGGTSERTKVGHSFIKERMRAKNALFAGESAGHYYFKDNYFADSGLIAAIIGIQILSNTNKSLSTLVDELSTYVSIAETNYEVSNKDAVMQSIADYYGTTAEVDWLDGVSVHMETAWCNVRPSNTEPLLRFNAEATTKEELDTLVHTVSAIIKQS